MTSGDKPPKRRKAVKRRKVPLTEDMVRRIEEALEERRGPVDRRGSRRAVEGKHGTERRQRRDRRRKPKTPPSI